MHQRVYAHPIILKQNFSMSETAQSKCTMLECWHMPDDLHLRYINTNSDRGLYTVGAEWLGHHLIAQDCMSSSLQFCSLLTIASFYCLLYINLAKYFNFVVANITLF